jgi:DNA polymerase-3 subunit delta
MITLYSGENSYESWKEFIALKKEIAKDLSNELTIVNGDEISSISELFASSEMATFFTSNTVVFVKRLFKNRSKNLLESVTKYIEKNPNTNLIMWEEGEPDKRLKLYKTINKIAEVKQYKNLKSHQLIFWVRDQIESNDLKISDQLIDKFISRVGTDQFVLDNEISKLSNYLKSENKKEVDEKDIKKINTHNPEDSVWEFMDSLTIGNKAKSLLILENLVNDISEYQIFLGLITRQLKLLMMVKLVSNSTNDVAKTIGEHPFVVRKLVSSISKYNIKRIKIAFERLLNLDKMIKTGMIEPKLGLDLFVITF